MVITIAKCKECTYPRVLPVVPIAPDIALPVVSISHHTQSLLHGNLSSAQRQQTRIILTVRGFPEFPECFHSQAPVLDCRWFLGFLRSARVPLEEGLYGGFTLTIPAIPANHLRMIIATIGVRRKIECQVNNSKEQRKLLCVVLDNDLPVEGFLTDG